MKINFRAYLVVLSLVAVIYFVGIGFYEAIMKSDTSYGEAWNFMIIKVVEIFQFPFNLFISSASDYYLLGIMINLCLYSLLIYVVLKLIFKKYHKL